MKKNVLAVLLSLSFTLSACGQSMNDDKREVLPVSIGFWEISAMSSGRQDAFRASIENRFDISIEPISVEWSSYKDYYQMLSATNSLPDLFSTLTISGSDTNDSAFYETMIREGTIRSLPDDLSSWPNLERLMDMVSYTRYSDGKFYAIPRISFMDPILSSTDACLLVRRDWMENLGISDPTNLESFTNMVVAFAENDPDGNGMDDTIGYNVNALSALGKWVMLGIAPQCNVYSWVEKDGSFIPSWYTEDFRQVVSAYRTLYESGGLDPDFYIKNPNQVLDDFASGRLGAMEYKSSPSSLLQVKDAWARYNDAETFGECVDVLHIFPAGDGNCYSNTSSLFWSESFISAKVDDEKMTRILDLYDYLLSSEGLLMCKYGLQGVDFAVEEDGNIVSLAETADLPLRQALVAKYPSLALFESLASWGGTDNDFSLSDMNFSLYGEDVMQIASKDLSWNREHTIAVERPLAFMITPKESSEVFSTSAAFSAFVKCIIGSEEPLVMWETALDDMRAQGLDEYINRQNAIYTDKNSAVTAERN